MKMQYVCYGFGMVCFYLSQLMMVVNMENPAAPVVLALGLGMMAVGFFFHWKAANQEQVYVNCMTEETTPVSC